jgi:hypothetical protein
MNLILANNRLTDLGALIFAVIFTVLVFAVVMAVDSRDKRLRDARDLAAANKAGH